MTFLDEMKGAAATYGLTLSEEQLRRFQKYYDLLLEWNGRMNLTAITEPREVALKHIIDSLAGWKDHMAEDSRLIDVGTGAGFPGIPLKIYRPNLRLTLLDSLGKRVKFLEAVTEELGLEGAICIHGRAEDAARNKNLREKFQIAVSRAVARLPILAEYCLPFVEPGGMFLAWKGAQYREEAQEAQRAVTLLGGKDIEMEEIHLPGMEDQRAILRIPKIAPTPKTYPRRAGIPERKPL